MQLLGIQNKLADEIYDPLELSENVIINFGESARSGSMSIIEIISS